MRRNSTILTQQLMDLITWIKGDVYSSISELCSTASWHPDGDGGGSM